MPHGQLTPLGRQLRSVLAQIYITPRAQRTRHLHARNGNGYGIRDFHHSSPGASGPKSRNKIKKEAAAELAGKPGGKLDQSIRWQRLTTLLDTDHLSKAVQDAGHSIHQHPKNEADLYGSRSARGDAPHQADQDVPEKLSLQSILAKYIQDNKGEVDPLRAQLKSTYTPTESEMAFLARRGHTLRDLHAWSDIVLATDSTEAASRLAKRVSMAESDPLFVVLHLLGRECISANALRDIIISISSVLRERRDRNRSDNPILLIVVVRLIRHAREVWPQSFTSIASLFLARLRQLDEDPKSSPVGQDQLQFVTFALNKIMCLISLSTAAMPFKNNIFQEMAIIPVLQYMAEHNPPLQITRSGYRAVIRIQLAQRKTEDERQWAELKALSWPPWKVDRTAVDASVGLEYGISRARATLFSMRSVGYGPLAWERAAELLTGWDIDGAPTVQRRAIVGSHSSEEHQNSFVDDASTALGNVLSGSRGLQTRNNATFWAARIESTRTIQEAWACYLAWEDAKLPPDQEVYLSIMQKLHEQVNDQRETTQTEQHPAWDVLPGDTPRLSPLPPSTHLYTYTRTAPPTLDDFYQMLRGRGIQFTGHCLAFLLRSAPLATGLARMKDSLPQYPELWDFITYDSSHDLDKLPREIFTAAIQLLSRSGGYFLNGPEWNISDGPSESLNYTPFSDQVYRYKHSVIVRAMSLLRRKPNCGRPAWVAVFHGLTRESNFSGLGQALLARGRIDPNPPPEVGYLGAQLAYVMTIRTIARYREQFSDLDAVAFYRFCLVTESMLRSVWKLELMRDGNGEMRRVKETAGEWNINNKYVASGVASKTLRAEFAALVGDVKWPGGHAYKVIYGGVNLPRLLYIPNPAMLHAYIRALGWLSNYQGLKTLVLWMRDFKEELEERKGRDRLGRDMFRKAIVALRVFLEREWRVEGSKGGGMRRDLDARLGAAADAEVVDAIRDVVDSVEEWEGWATDGEARAYAADERFDGLRGD